MEDLLIYNAEIWPLDGSRVISGGWLTAKNGTITAVAAGDPPAELSAGTVVDGAGMVLMPGMADCHTHLMEYATAEINATRGRAQSMSAVANLLTALRCGIVATGEHNLGHPTLSMPMEEYKTILRSVPMASAVAYGCCWLGFEPKVLTSATRPGQAFSTDVLTDGDYAAMAEASEFAGESLFLNCTCANAPLSAAPHAGEVTYDRQTLEHIVELFHARGRAIGAHIEGDEAARLFIECGGDVIHHGHNTTPEVWKLMAEKGVALVLTPAAGTSKRPLTPEQTLELYRAGVFLALASDSYIYPHPQADWERLPADRLAGPESFMAMVAPVLRHLVQHGLTREEALHLITVNPRRLLHPGEELAVLKPGSPADMILCRRLPALETEDPNDILLVITGGELQVDKRK